MINAQMKLYNYSTFGALDEYGQETLSASPVGTIRLALNTSNITTGDNIKYKDATYTALTFDSLVNDSFVIHYGEERLKVLYVMPFGRYKQVFLKEI